MDTDDTWKKEAVNEIFADLKDGMDDDEQDDLDNMCLEDRLDYLMKKAYLMYRV